MAILESSWVLIPKLKTLQCSNELKNAILTYIELNPIKKGLPISGCITRGNFHYIIDNINTPTLLNELIESNKKT